MRKAFQLKHENIPVNVAAFSVVGATSDNTRLVQLLVVSGAVEEVTF